LSLPNEISRDPAFYQLSGHAFLRSKQRGIDRELVDEAIREGVVQHARGQGNIRFIHQPEDVDEEIALIADAYNGDVATVMWNFDYDATNDQLGQRATAPGRDR
jgi:hypothetical protein